MAKQKSRKPQQGKTSPAQKVTEKPVVPVIETELEEEPLTEQEEELPTCPAPEGEDTTSDIPEIHEITDLPQETAPIDPGLYSIPEEYFTTEPKQEQKGSEGICPEPTIEEMIATIDKWNDQLSDKRSVAEGQIAYKISLAMNHLAYAKNELKVVIG